MPSRGFVGVPDPTALILSPKSASAARPSGTSGKHPMIEGGFYSATTDRGVIAGWDQWEKGANIGIRGGGANQLLVIDVDCHKPVADAEFAKLEFEYGKLTRDWMVATGGGGVHFWVMLPDGIQVKFKNGWRPGIDLRNNTGYAIAPPSLHKSGKRYLWSRRISSVPPILPSAWLPALPIIQASKPPLDQWMQSSRADATERDREGQQERDTEKTERAERAERAEREVNQILSVLSVHLCHETNGWSQGMLPAYQFSIELCVVTETDTHNDKRMALARRLKAHPELKDLDGESLDGRTGLGSIALCRALRTSTNTGAAHSESGLSCGIGSETT